MLEQWPRLLLLSDSSAFSEKAHAFLRRGDCEVLLAQSLDNMGQLISSTEVDAVVIGEWQPRQVLQRAQRLVSARSPSSALIVIGSLDDVGERLDLWKTGVDALVKVPISVLEFRAMIRAVVRRVSAQVNALPDDTAGRHGPRLIIDGLELWEEDSLAFCQGAPLKLNHVEFELLLYLAARAPEPVENGKILRDVFKLDRDHGSNIVAVCVHRLRRKLDERGSSLTIGAVRGQGYSLRHREGVLVS